MPTGKDPAAKEAIQWALDIQSTFLDMLRSTTTWHPPTVLELRPVETTSISQLEVHLQAASVKQLPANHDIIEPSACQQIGVHNNVSYDSSLNADVVDLIPMLVDSMRIVLYLKVTVEGAENTLTHETCFACPQNM